MMHIETLLMTGVLISTVLAAALVYAFWPLRSQAEDSARHSQVLWARGVLVQASFWLLFFFGRDQPIWLSIVIINTISVWAIAEYGRAVFAFLNLPNRDAWFIGIVSTVMAGNVWFGYVAPDYDARVIVVSAASAGILLWASWRLLTWTDPTLTQGCRLTALAFLIGASGMLVRLNDVVFQPGLSASQSSPQQWALLVFAVLPAFASLGFLLMHASRANARLSALAGTDPLTGTMNRRALDVAAARALADCRRQRRPASVMLIDIDHFKRINDEHGHEVGDRTLIALVGRLGECLRQEDSVARLGGEEFVVLLPGADRTAAVAVAERIRRRIQSCAAEDAKLGVVLTVSIGVAQWRSEENTIEPALRRADTAMYQAKLNGRNRVVVAGEGSLAGDMRA